MRIFKILFQEAGYRIFLFGLLGLVSGLLQAMMLPFITMVIGSYAGQEYMIPSYLHIILFFTLVLLMVTTRRVFSRFMTGLTQKLILRIRMSILKSIRKANYYQFEKIGKEEIYTAITRDANIVSSSAISIIYATTSTITILTCLSYLAYLSWVGFAATLVTMGIATGFFLLRRKRVEAIFKEIRVKETLFFKHINELLTGFKEVKVDRLKNDDLFENHIAEVSQQTKKLSLFGLNYYLDNNLVSTAAFYLLIAFILFVFPLMGLPATSIVSYIFVVLYIMGPIEAVMNSIPVVAQANISLSSIERIQQRAAEMMDQLPEQIVPIDFQSLKMKDLVFNYDSSEKDSFGIGPIDFEIDRGELVFIVGGNGSGKTTFFKTLTGLYTQNGGSILVNEQTPELNAYRDLFSPIFSDFFLFEKLYGQDNPDKEVIDEWIKRMRLESKVNFDNNIFSTTSLSTGQRKRLALIAAIQESKSILVLDEWAADQDPQFRKFFYRELLPELRDRGMTIIAITHDDRYFDVADRLYKMDEGKLTLESNKALGATTH